MALILCDECGRSISDKASSCPGCGYPIQQADKKQMLQNEQIDFKRLSKEELWHKAYNIQYKQSKDNLPLAIDIYTYIAENFSLSTEADYARRQLEIINTGSRATLPIPANIDKALANNNSDESIYNYVSSTGSESVNRVHSIPTHGGLAVLAFIMGFGILGGIVLGSHLRTKKLIANGEYEAALQASSTTFFGAMLIIIGMPILAAIIIFSLPH